MYVNMVRFHRTILRLVYLYVLVTPMLALRCYFCADSGLENKCGNYNVYLDARRERTSRLLRNCSVGNDNICFIETYKSQLGDVVSEIRDCSDGTSFSFSTSEHIERYRKLNELTINNRTRCVYDGINQVCLSKCVTDFCNGPQPVDQSINGMTSYFMMVNVVIFTNFVAQSFLIHVLAL